MKTFWKEFLSGSSDVVHSPTVIGTFIALALATPIVLLSGATIIYHVFYLKKGLDTPTVNLLLGLLGTGTGGLVGSFWKMNINPAPVTPGGKIDGIQPRS